MHIKFNGRTTGALLRNRTSTVSLEQGVPVQSALVEIFGESIRAAGGLISLVIVFSA